MVRHSTRIELDSASTSESLIWGLVLTASATLLVLSGVVFMHEDVENDGSIVNVPSSIDDSRDLGEINTPNQP
jgi:hypothetical protein